MYQKVENRALFAKKSSMARDRLMEMGGVTPGSSGIASMGPNMAPPMQGKGPSGIMSSSPELMEAAMRKAPILPAQMNAPGAPPAPRPPAPAQAPPKAFAVGGQVNQSNPMSPFDAYNRDNVESSLESALTMGRSTPPMQGIGGLGMGQMPGMGQARGPGGMSAQLDQYGQYLDHTYGDVEFDRKRDTFLSDLGSKEQQTFGQGGFGGGSIGGQLPPPMNQTQPFQGMGERLRSAIGFDVGGTVSAEPLLGLRLVEDPLKGRRYKNRWLVRSYPPLRYFKKPLGKTPWGYLKGCRKK